MEGRLMFNPGQELMQGFCQETMQPLTQRMNVDQMPNLSTITGCLSVSGLWLFLTLSPQYFLPLPCDCPFTEQDISFLTYATFKYQTNRKYSLQLSVFYIVVNTLSVAGGAQMLITGSVWKFKESFFFNFWPSFLSFFDLSCPANMVSSFALQWKSVT